MAPLNGVEAEDKVAEVFGWDNLLYSLAKVSVVMKDAAPPLIQKLPGLKWEKSTMRQCPPGYRP